MMHRIVTKSGTYSQTYCMSVHRYLETLAVGFTLSGGKVSQVLVELVRLSALQLKGMQNRYFQIKKATRLHTFQRLTIFIQKVCKRAKSFVNRACSTWLQIFQRIPLSDCLNNQFQTSSAVVLIFCSAQMLRYYAATQQYIFDSSNGVQNWAIIVINNNNCLSIACIFY